MAQDIIQILDCYINLENKTFVIKHGRGDETTGTRAIRLAEFNLEIEKDKEFLIEANRHYISNARKNYPNHTDYDGLLPLGCLIQDRKIPIDECISPKYLLNCFVHLMDLLFNDNKSSPQPNIIFDRNNEIIIPASDDRMRGMMNEMLDKQSTAITQLNQTGFGGDQLSVFLSIYLNQMKNLEESLSKKMENVQNSRKLKRNINIMGGVNLQDATHDGMGGKFALNEMISSIGESKDQVHAFIRDNNAAIIHECLKTKRDDGDNALRSVLDILREFPRVPIYHNSNITYPLMFRTLGQVFEVLFMKMIPKISMTLSMIGSIYYASFLREMKLFDEYSYQLQFPIILRVLYSCYPDDTVSPSTPRVKESEAYVKKYYESVYGEIQNVRKNGILASNQTDDTQRRYDNNQRFITKVAAKFHLEDKDFSDHLYNVLNVQRGRTYEYYLVAILGLYLNGISKAQGLTKKLDRESNGIKFIAPVHRILTEIYQFCNAPGTKEAMLDDSGYIKYEYVQQFLQLFNENKGEVLEECIKESISVIGHIIGENVSAEKK